MNPNLGALRCVSVKEKRRKNTVNPRLRFKQDDGTDYPDWEEKKLGEVTEDIRGGFGFPINEQGKK